MAYTDAKEIRSILQQRYGVDLQERISRVEFVLPNGERPYFHVEDDYRPHIEPEPQPEYTLLVYDGEEPRTMHFKSLQTLLTSFASFQRLNLYRLVAMQDGMVIQKYIPTK